MARFVAPVISAAKVVSKMSAMMVCLVSFSVVFLVLAGLSLLIGLLSRIAPDKSTEAGE